MATIVSYVVTVGVVISSIAMLAIILNEDVIPWARKKLIRESVPFTFISHHDVGCYSHSGLYLFATCPGCNRDIALKVHKECSMETVKIGVFFGLECYYCDEVINIMVRKDARQNR